VTADVTAEQIDELLRTAHDARTRAYAPYSDFTVGSAVLAGGRIYSGCNVENASYGLSICAERVAATTAVAAGERRIDAVAVVGSSGRPTPPCGACRQVLNEFGPSMAVVVETFDGVLREEWSLDAILPHAFGPDYLKE